MIFLSATSHYISHTYTYKCPPPKILCVLPSMSGRSGSQIRSVTGHSVNWGEKNNSCIHRSEQNRTRARTKRQQTIIAKKQCRQGILLRSRVNKACLHINMACQHAEQEWKFLKNLCTTSFDMPHSKELMFSKLSRFQITSFCPLLCAS